MTDFRALCAELAYELDAETGYTTNDGVRITHPTVVEARAALAQPEPQGPTDEEIYKLALDGDFLADVGDGFSCMVQDEVEFARAVLARYGRPAIEPVPQGPSDQELLRCMIKATESVQGGQSTGIIDWEAEALAAARAVLARYGRPAIKPVP